MIAPGYQLGNYQISRLIGHGGFADVYLSKHIYLNTRAAIKVLHTRVGQDRLSMQYFLNEAQMIAHLTHPHIVRVLEFGIEQGTPYLVMDFAPNGTLRQHLPRQTPISLALAVHYLRQVASALQYAHDHQVIHRDIKPENFLLGASYEVLLSDFGVASLAHSSKSLSTQEVAGTIAYMAPEQIEGKPRQASDQYALGIVLYEWLTGRHPFSGSFMEIATQHMFTPPPPLRALDPAIPAEIEEIVLIALAKKPEERFQSVGAFAHALEQVALPRLTPEETLWINQPPGSPDVQEMLQKTLGVALATATPTLLPGEVATIPPHANLLPVSESGADLSGAPVTTDKRPARFPRRAFVNGAAGFALVAGAGAVAFWQLGTHAGGAQVATPTPSLQSTSTAQGVQQTPTTAPTPDPAAGSQSTQTVVYNQGSQAYSVAWNRGGTLIASAGNSSLIKIWNPLNATQTQANLPTGQTIVYQLAWSPDNTLLAAAYGDGTAGLWDMTSNSQSGSLYGVHTKHINSIGWSPDGAYLVTGSGDGLAVVWDASSRTLRQVYTGHTGYVNTVAWSPAGDLVASGGKDTVLQIWNPATAQAVAAGVGHAQEILDVAWAPDGNRVVTASRDGTAKVWDAHSGNLLLTYTRHRSFVVAVAWAPDGSRVVSGGGDHLTLPNDTSAQVWNSNTGQLLAMYTRHLNEIEGIAWSPDSHRVASASDDGTVQIWPV